MSSTTGGARPGSGTTRQPAGARPAAPKLNRAQVQAMKIRAAATVVEEAQGGSGSAIVDIEAPRHKRTGSSRLIKKPVAKPVLLTRAQEFRYVRADLKRLAITASSLFAVMIVLLFIIAR